jgi:hypothetical protein
VTAANALGLASLSEKPLNESSDKDFPVSTKLAASTDINRDETPFEALASTCSVLMVGLFILTFLAQNYVIPSGSMENTLLVGDHLVVDQITLMPPASWMPLIRYREPRRGDIVVFHKPVNQSGIDATERRRNTTIHSPGEEVDWRTGRSYSSTQRHCDFEWRRTAHGICAAEHDE